MWHSSHKLNLQKCAFACLQSAMAAHCWVRAWQKQIFRDPEQFCQSSLQWHPCCPTGLGPFKWIKGLPFFARVSRSEPQVSAVSVPHYRLAGDSRLSFMDMLTDMLKSQMHFTNENRPRSVYFLHGLRNTVCSLRCCTTQTLGPTSPVQHKGWGPLKNTNVGGVVTAETYNLNVIP